MASAQAVALKGRFDGFMAGTVGDDGAPIPLDEMRRKHEAFCLDLTPQPAGVTWETVDAGGVPAIWAVPAGGASGRVILYAHGGGYMLGCAAGYTHVTGHLATAAGCRVLSVDYRLAPEHPHPAPLEDYTTAYRWLLAQGVEATHIVLAGDSAGGGLTLATLQSLRDAGTPLPAGAVPLSPWVDLEMTGETLATNAAHDFVQREMLEGMAQLFLNGQDAKDPLAAPLHGNLAGLPPLYIQAGGHESLLADSQRIAEAARRAGVDVTLDVFPEMIHVFQVGVGSVPEADDAVAKIGAFVKARVGL